MDIRLATGTNTARMLSSLMTKMNRSVIRSSCLLYTSAHQMKGSFNYAAENMFKTLTPHMGGAFKFFFANQWLFGGLLKSILCKIPASAALIRTTFAPTQLSGSNAPNVLARCV